MTEKKEFPTMMDVLTELKGLNEIVQNNNDIKQNVPLSP